MQKFLKHCLACGEDATLSAVIAVQDLQNGDTLCLEGRELHFYSVFGFQRICYISNNDSGIKSIAFPLIKKKNITIDGQGAKLVFHGKILPFVVDQSENIIIKNLTVDYAEPMYFAAKITDSAEDFVEMEYDDSVFHCEAVGGHFRFWGENWENVTDTVLVNEFEAEYMGPTPDTPTYMACLSAEKCTTFMAPIYRYLTASKPAPNRLRLEGELGYRHTVGKYWLCTPHLREYPGMFCNDSQNIRIQNVKIIHAQSMGVICQLCENVTLDGVVVKAGEGRLLSTNADATHFVNCSGLVNVKNCTFENMMDDAGNFHGMYMPVVRRIAPNQALLTFGHYQQKGVNIFRPGDTIRIVDHKTLMPYASFTVKCSTLISPDYVLLETQELLPERIPDGYVFENHSRMPEIHIENCNSGYNRPRGFLLSTNRDVLVEGCAFHNLNYAVSLTGDALDWFESGAGGKVVLRNNRFDNASYAGDPVIRTQSRIQKETGQPYHESLIVENNYFRTNGRRFLDVAHIDTVIFRNNTFVQDDTLPGGSTLEEDGFAIRACNAVQIEKI